MDKWDACFSRSAYGWRDQMLPFKKPVWGKARLTGEIFSDKGWACSGSSQVLKR